MMKKTRLKDYKKIVGSEAIEEIRTLAEKLKGTKVVHINSTRTGGGVAEILQRLIPLLNEVGLEARWEVIKGDEEFFKITKTFHNALHGANVPLNKKMFDYYLETNKKNAVDLDLDADIVIVHDPQPAALINYRRDKKTKWVWRCHIDVSTPNPELWNFLKTLVSKYDAAVFHTEKFAKNDLSIRQFIVPPAIDPLSEKNMELTPAKVNAILRNYSIDHDKPIVTQVGRFDRLKDPQGVVKMYRMIKKPKSVLDIKHLFGNRGMIDIARMVRGEVDFHLILAGGFATDDPEGREVYEEVKNNVEGDKDIHLILNPPDLAINAIQRISDIVVQKSLKEGFGLTVSEGLWKSKPVIGGNTGGIPLQIIDGLDGYLVSGSKEAAGKVRYLLKNPQKAKKMGELGKEHVRGRFLTTRYLKDVLLSYMTLKYVPCKLVQL